MPAPKGNVPKRRGVYGWSLLNHIRYMAQKPLYYKPPPYYSAMLAVPPTQGPYRQKQKGKLFFDEDKLRAKLEPKSLWVRRDWRRGNLGFWSYGMNNGGTAIKRIKSLMAQGYSEDDALKIFETEQIEQFKRKKKQIQWVTEEEGFTFRDGVEVLRLMQQVKTSTKDELIGKVLDLKRKREHNYALDDDNTSASTAAASMQQNPQLNKTLHYLNKANVAALKLCAARASLTNSPVYTDISKDSVISPFDLFSIYIHAFNVAQNPDLETYKVPYYNGRSSRVYMDSLYEEFRDNMAEFMKFSPAALEKSMIKTIKQSGILEGKIDEKNFRPYVVFEKLNIVPPDFSNVFNQFSQLDWSQFETRMGQFRNRFEYFYAFIKFMQLIENRGINFGVSPEVLMGSPASALFQSVANIVAVQAPEAIEGLEKMRESVVVADNKEEWIKYKGG
eukprot:CAMPEP_0117449354 /NCGR_PEP_ID=MMETSP0759-20121206/7902_1 /TAXON_ID=63605 /ORGANISM="Percolomonas cosmopolitus, Strain WS" /LENGTH=445 /DNA_ID=CAMNT_0005241827 /DNA_START=81 /DNA_END=1413 /DNA_ORIENTATION=-